MKAKKSPTEVALLDEIVSIFVEMVGLKRVSVEKDVEKEIIHYRITVEGFASLEKVEEG